LLWPVERQFKEYCNGLKSKLERDSEVKIIGTRARSSLSNNPASFGAMKACSGPSWTWPSPVDSSFVLRAGEAAEGLIFNVADWGLSDFTILLKPSLC
jgi:hypothetical protein